MIPDKEMNKMIGAMSCVVNMADSKPVPQKRWIKGLAMNINPTTNGKLIANVKSTTLPTSCRNSSIRRALIKFATRGNKTVPKEDTTPKIDLVIRVDAV